MRWRGLAIAAAMLAVTARGRAEDPDAVSRAADAHARGMALLERGDAHGACALFADAMRLQPKGLHAKALGDCHATLGRVVDARHWYREALVFARKKGVRAETERELDARLGAVAARVATLELLVPREVASAAGVVARRDGQTVDLASRSTVIELDPGTHVVELAAAGRAPARWELRLVDGEQRTLALELGPAVAPAPQAAPAAQPSVPPREQAGPTPGRRTPTAAWALAGTGAVLAAVGAYAWVVRDRHLSRRDALCPARCERDDDYQRATSEAADARAAQRWSALALGGAAVAWVGAGAVAWRSAPSASVQLGPTGASLQLGAGF